MYRINNNNIHNTTPLKNISDPAVQSDAEKLEKTRFKGIEELVIELQEKDHGSLLQNPSTADNAQHEIGTVSSGPEVNPKGSKAIDDSSSQQSRVDSNIDAGVTKVSAILLKPNEKNLTDESNKKAIGKAEDNHGTVNKSEFHSGSKSVPISFKTNDLHKSAVQCDGTKTNPKKNTEICYTKCIKVLKFKNITDDDSIREGGNATKNKEQFVIDHTADNDQHKKRTNNSNSDIDPKRRKIKQEIHDCESNQYKEEKSLKSNNSDINPSILSEVDSYGANALHVGYLNDPTNSPDFDDVNISTAMSISYSDDNAPAPFSTAMSIGYSDDNAPAPFPTDELNLRHPVQWDQTLQQLIMMKKQKVSFDETILANLRRTLECHGAPLNVLEHLITMYSKELGFSIILSATRFHLHSKILMNQIFSGIKKESEANMDYCINKFQGDITKVKSDHTVIGEAMTLIFSKFDDYIATPLSGNLEVLKIIKCRYPMSILYIDTLMSTPLHGVCEALNMGIIKFFINWHLEQCPHGRGGLYQTNIDGLTSLDTLIDTQMNIVPILEWLCSRGLLNSGDVDSKGLVRRAIRSSSISTIEFMLGLFPSAVLAVNDDGDLPIHLHLYRERASFSNEDFAITELLIRCGISHVGIDTIGGLFYKNPTDSYCVLEYLLRKSGVNNTEKVWSMIESCLDKAGGYTNAHIVHAAIRNKEVIPDELFKEALLRFGAKSHNEDQELPLQYALKRGLGWADGVSDILESNRAAVHEMNWTDLERADLETIYEVVCLINMINVVMND